MSAAREHRLRGRIAWLLLAASGAALLVGGMGAAQLRHQVAKGPALVSPHGLAVDAAGHLYCGVAGTDVHVYTPDGVLVHAWTVPDTAGPLRLALAPDGALEVAGRGDGRVHIYEPDGALRESRADPGAWERLGAAHDRAFRTPDGALYRFEGMSLVRAEPAPARVVVAAPRWPLRIFAAQPLLIAVLLFLGGFGPLAAVYVLRARGDA